jgi:uncharacterized protein (TIGR01777 family)
MKNSRVVIAGGSGFLGASLARDLLSAGCEVVVLTRTPRKRSDGAVEIAWDGRTSGDWIRSIDGARAIVNLTGKSVHCRYTESNRREIVSSRVDSVHAIAKAILAASSKPAVWIQSGSLAIYGDSGDRICDETSPAGQGFSAETCLSWERAFQEANSSNLESNSTRQVLLRIGFALDAGGGALETLASLARRFLGGTTGRGNQFISWLHVEDLNRMMRWAMARDEVAGIFNATGPNPVTNHVFMRELRRAVGRPWSPPVPKWAVRVGARLMNTEPELALSGRRCVPSRLLSMGFKFKHPDLRDALVSALT